VLEGTSIGSSADKVLKFAVIPHKNGDTFVAKRRSFNAVFV